MNLNGIQIAAKSPRLLAEFYTEAFGQPKWTLPGEWYGWDIGSGHLFFGPDDEIAASAIEPQRIMLAVETADVQGAFQTLIAAGGKKIVAPYKPDPKAEDFWQATVADPEGNYLLLANPV